MKNEMKRSKCFKYHDEIKSMIIAGMTNPEIATELKISKASLAIYVQRVLSGNPNYLKRKTKHKHLHEKILKMRLEISDDKIREELGLTKSEMKSCMSLAYRDQKLKHLRKEHRRRDAWSAEEYRFLLRYSGVIPRKQIAQELKRGKSEIVIKEKLQLLGLCSKNVNGLTFSQFTKLFKTEPYHYLATNAGSPTSKFAVYANWKMVPWCHIDEMIKDGSIHHSRAIELYIETMAMFQKWVHGEKYWESLMSKPKFKVKQYTR